MRKSHENAAVAAIASKLAVSIWYTLGGLFTPLKEAEATLRTKLTKIATAIGLKILRMLGYKSSSSLIEDKITRRLLWIAQ